MELIKLIHISSAFLSISGFVLRGIWMIAESGLLSHKLSKILPHVNDTILLSTAIWLAWSFGISPLANMWLLAKIGALLVYIALGLVVFRFGKNKQQKIAAWIAAIVVFAYIVTTAVTKDAAFLLGIV